MTKKTKPHADAIADLIVVRHTAEFPEQTITQALTTVCPGCKDTHIYIGDNERPLAEYRYVPKKTLLKHRPHELNGTKWTAVLLTGDGVAPERGFIRRVPQWH